MYLQKLELQGFKSFAPKTALQFLAPTAEGRGITAVVGPNGSGKSNIADAIRWALGEQSVKLLRGKKSEDVIFSGTDKRARAGFAEVSLHFNNEDGQAPIDYREIWLARRLFRDGESEYLLNKSKVRLADIQLLLAKAAFGQRTYSVIGQGMIDSLLLLSPEERKHFFDEAAGVRPYQIKKEQATSKLEAAAENMKQVEALVAEIEPRLRSLARQAKRLEERSALEEELHGLEHLYYGSLWNELQKQIAASGAELAEAEKELARRQTELKEIQTAFAKLERQKPAGEKMRQRQEEYEVLLERRQSLREKEMAARAELATLKTAEGPVAPPFPISQIVTELAAIAGEHEELIDSLDKVKTLDELVLIRERLKKISGRTAGLLSELRGNDRDGNKNKERGAQAEKLSRLAAEINEVSGRLTEIKEETQGDSQREDSQREEFFNLQRAFQARQEQVSAAERSVNDIRVSVAREETRRESLEAEMTNVLKERLERVKAAVPADAAPESEIFPKIQKLRYQLELIGGIDPEVAKEYQETNSRHEFLTGQLEDLKKAMADLRQAIAELEQTIETQFKTAFARINDDFSRFFQVLFNGGSAKLVKMDVEEEGASADTFGEEEAGGRAVAAEDSESGRAAKTVIEIQATPPGKRVKNIQVLSGGEKALTAIALICAILSNNPSPFVVLDEVDAALDEFNSVRFASILEELSHRTQFIVITHNRATMQKARILYGVTIGDDGVSRLLSVKLEEAAKSGA